MAPSRVVAAETLAALPFAVSYDRPSATDARGWRLPLEAVAVPLRGAPDGVDGERIARTAEAGARWSARISGATITLRPRGQRGDHLEMLAGLLSTWGAELHASHGIVGVATTWRPPTGPPMSLQLSARRRLRARGSSTSAGRTAGTDRR